MGAVSFANRLRADDVGLVGIGTQTGDLFEAVDIRKAIDNLREGGGGDGEVVCKGVWGDRGVLKEGVNKGIVA